MKFGTYFPYVSPEGYANIKAITVKKINKNKRFVMHLVSAECR